MTHSSSRLIVLAPPELSAGFQLAGVEVRSVDSVSDTEKELRLLEDEDEQGVIAVYRPLLDELDPDLVERLESTMHPVVVALPSGLGSRSESDRRARLMDRLQRAVGYRITFGGDE
jgi:vacuolar-type H+-ATPase subunit F/Vma7